MEKRIVFASIIVVVIATVSLNSAIADTSIPQWIKNTAKYWVNGDVGDADFLNAIQYLVQKGIIQVNIPVKEVAATNGAPSDNDRVTSFTVRFSNIINAPRDLPTTITVNTFQRIYEFGQTSSGYSNVGTQTTVKTNPQFQLYDLPSKDKSQFYELLNSALSTGQNVQNNAQTTFDVLIDLYTGDGTLLHTLEYDKCTVVTYFVNTNADKNDYRMSPTSQDAEDREATNFNCQGYHLDLPSKTTSP